jgi:pyruvate/2-oxoglutarate dehydrogenase complex dihydrolipoamide dehydrogenase (E3) component
MLIYPADLMTHIREDTKKFGISVNEPTIDFKKLITRVNRDIQKDSESIEPAYIKDPLVTLYK